MTIYIVCQKRRNSPRMDIRVCAARCRQRDACPEYLQHLKSSPEPGGFPLPVAQGPHGLPHVPQAGAAA